MRYEKYPKIEDFTTPGLPVETHILYGVLGLLTFGFAWVIWVLHILLNPRKIDYAGFNQAQREVWAWNNYVYARIQAEERKEEEREGEDDRVTANHPG